MDVGDASFDKSLSLLGMFTLTESVAADGQIDDLIDEALCDLVKINEQATSIGVHIECFIKVFAMVNFLNQLDDDLWDTVDLFLFGHKIDFVVQCLGNLEDWMNQEAIRKGFLGRAIKAKHFLA